MSVERRSEQACFGGRIGFYTHRSDVIRSDMRFAVYLPPQAERGKVPALYYLAGLTCTEETFMIKAGAQRLAAEHGLALVACDTSPRGLNLPGDSEAWDFGVGAGFYLNATAPPWSTNYHMGSYVNEELPAVVEKNFPIATDRRGIFGHSMGRCNHRGGAWLQHVPQHVGFRQAALQQRAVVHRADRNVQPRYQPPAVPRGPAPRRNETAPSS